MATKFFGINDQYFLKSIYHLALRWDQIHDLTENKEQRVCQLAPETVVSSIIRKSSIPHVVYQTPVVSELDVTIQEEKDIGFELFCKIMNSVVHGSASEKNEFSFELMDSSLKGFLTNNDVCRMMMCFLREVEIKEMMPAIEKIFPFGDRVDKVSYDKISRKYSQITGKIIDTLSQPFQLYIEEVDGLDSEETGGKYALSLDEDSKGVQYEIHRELLVKKKGDQVKELIGEFRFGETSTKDFGIFHLQNPDLFHSETFRKACVIDGVRHRGVAYIVGIRIKEGVQDVISISFHKTMFSELTAARWYEQFKSRLPIRTWTISLTRDTNDDWNSSLEDETETDDEKEDGRKISHSYNRKRNSHTEENTEYEDDWQ